MRVSKFLYVLILAIAFVASFIFGPISAGEHPWAEDPFNTPSDTNGGSMANSIDGDNGDSEASSGVLFGSDLYWLGLIIDGATDNGGLDLSPDANSTTP